MRVIAANLAASTGSKLSSVSSQVKTTWSRLSKAEVAEALIATWCIEFLRVRRIGGFNVVQIISVSLLMLIIKQIVFEASRRNAHGKQSMEVSRWSTPLEPVGSYQRRTISDRRP
jgi:hypothetical protein